MCASCAALHQGSKDPPWLIEYKRGCDFEIYRVPVSPELRGMAFAEAASRMYATTGIIVFALETQVMTASGTYKPHVVLGPMQCKIPPAHLKPFVYVIAEDRAHANLVGRYSKCTPARVGGGLRVADGWGVLLQVLEASPSSGLCRTCASCGSRSPPWALAPAHPARRRSPRDHRGGTRRLVAHRRS